MLREDYLKPMDMSANALGRQLHVPASRINDIVLERRGITADTALHLSRFFGGDAQLWLNLQTAYDLRVALTVKPNDSWNSQPSRWAGRLAMA